jgi:hypothetical protein
MEVSEAQAIVSKYTAAWEHAGRDRMWVVLASPGEPVNIPGISFGDQGSSHAGMEVAVRAHVIVLNKAMRAESLLSTFLHEYGHALYRSAQPDPFDPIESEAFAIKHSLQALESGGLSVLAFQEASAVAQMASVEPYRSAVARLCNEPLWQKYCPRAAGG